MFLQLLQYPSNGFHILFAFTFDIDENVIEVHYHENVKLFCQDLIDVILEYGQCIDQSKRHHLVLKIAIADFESCFPFTAFSDPHSMVGIG